MKSGRWLWESKALYDNLYPRQIIVGTDSEDEWLVKAAGIFAELLREGAMKGKPTEVVKVKYGADCVLDERKIDTLIMGAMVLCQDLVQNKLSSSTC